MKFAQGGYFRSKTEKNEYSHGIWHIQIRLGIKFPFKLTNLIFCTKFAQEGYYRSKTDKVNTTIEFYVLELVVSTKFQLELTKKRIQLKIEKVNFTIEICRSN